MDQAAQAEQGIGLIYQTGKLAEAIKQYRKVAGNLSASWRSNAGFTRRLEISVDLKKALPDLQAFVKKYPDGKFTAQAAMMMSPNSAVGDGRHGVGDADLQGYRDQVS